MWTKFQRGPGAADAANGDARDFASQPLHIDDETITRAQAGHLAARSPSRRQCRNKSVSTS